jgi:hypothetical protein
MSAELLLRRRVPSPSHLITPDTSYNQIVSRGSPDDNQAAQRRQQQLRFVAVVANRSLTRITPWRHVGYETILARKLIELQPWRASEWRNHRSSQVASIYWQLVQSWSPVTSPPSSLTSFFQRSPSHSLLYVVPHTTTSMRPFFAGSASILACRLADTGVRLQISTPFHPQSRIRASRP